MTQWGDFEVDLSEPLGSGAMGTVYRGTQVSLRRPVAVKIISPGLPLDRTLVSRFEQEALAMARVSHPNVVQVYGAGEDDGRPWFAMEFVEGEDLYDLLDRRGPLPPEEVARIGIQIANGIGAALDRGVVHRDLKPSNVLILPDGAVKVMDFGLAKLISEGSQTTLKGTVLGTPLYMSPEQAMGRSVDGRTDIYSLGVILFELAAGRPPFQAESITSIVYMHVHEPPTPLEKASAGVPRALGRVVARCLEKDPAQRYQTPAELAEALEQFLRDSKGPARVRVKWAVPAAVSAAALVLAVNAWRGGARREESSPARTHVAAPTAPPAPQPVPPQPAPPSPNPAPASVPHTSQPAIVAPPPAVDPFDKARAEGEAHVRANEMAEAAASFRAALAVREDAATREMWLHALEALSPEGMVFVRGATFTQGGEGEEGPPHEVSVSPFYLDRTEVTNAQYAAFLLDMEAHGDHSRCNPAEPAGKSHVPRFRDMEALQAADQPVVGVDWWDASAYAAWAGKRLPTESEWELAARGTDGRTYPWGAVWDARCVNTQDPSDGFDSVAPVGRFPLGATPLGIVDMAGNVSEWCADWWAPYAPAKGVAADPAGPATGTSRVVRGGSCGHKAEASFRGARRGQREDPGARITTLGFRCAEGIDDAPSVEPSKGK